MKHWGWDSKCWVLKDSSGENEEAWEAINGLIEAIVISIQCSCQIIAVTILITEKL